METGKLDRRVAFQALTETYNDYNEPVRTWATSFTVWARELPKKMSEKFTGEGRRTEQLVVFEVRYRTDILESMRALYRGSYYRILGIENLGRNRRLNIICESIEGSGFNG